MKKKLIEVMKTWPEPKLKGVIYLYLSFANIYKRFIKNFSKIVITLTLLF